MAIAYTPRLQLSKPDADEFQLVGVLNSNSDLIDKYVGARVVANNITPPLNELFEGAIIREKTSGKTWVAISNAAGGFDKSYMEWGETTPWSAVNLAPNWAAVHGAYPLPQCRRANGFVEFSGGAYYAPTMVGGSNYLMFSHAYITAGAHPDQTASNVQAIGTVGTTPNLSGECYILPNGTLAVTLSATSLNTVVNLDGVRWRDFSKG